MSAPDQPDIERALELARTCVDVWESEDRLTLQEPDDVLVARALLAEHERAEKLAEVESLWDTLLRAEAAEATAWTERAEAAEQRVQELEAALRDMGEVTVDADATGIVELTNILRAALGEQA